ncbi:hypothetical protein BC831DRAFT_482688, partial [Entophlyctis helioformis]
RLCHVLPALAAAALVLLAACVAVWSVRWAVRRAARWLAPGLAAYCAACPDLPATPLLAHAVLPVLVFLAGPAQPPAPSRQMRSQPCTPLRSPPSDGSAATTGRTRRDRPARRTAAAVQPSEQPLPASSLLSDRPATAGGTDERVARLETRIDSLELPHGADPRPAVAAAVGCPAGFPLILLLLLLLPHCRHRRLQCRRHHQPPPMPDMAQLTMFTRSGPSDASMARRQAAMDGPSMSDVLKELSNLKRKVGTMLRLVHVLADVLVKRDLEQFCLQYALADTAREQFAQKHLSVARGIRTRPCHSASFESDGSACR